MTPLMHATIGGFKDIIMLLSHGVSIEQADPHGRTALHSAVIEKQDASLKVLLEQGTEKQPLLLDSYDESGRTPLYLAVDGNFDAEVQLLLQFGFEAGTLALPITVVGALRTLAHMALIIKVLSDRLFSPKTR